MVITNRHTKGTKVRYRRHGRAARGGSVTATMSFGTVIGYYGELYVIESRHGRIITREYPSAIVETLEGFPQPR